MCEKPKLTSPLRYVHAWWLLACHHNDDLTSWNVSMTLMTDADKGVDLHQHSKRAISPARSSG